MARPPKPIDWDLVEAKVAAGCSGIEIAQDFRLDDNTFYSRFQKEYGESFSDYSCKQNRVGEGNIKYVQYIKAIGLSNKGELKGKGDTTLLIHLGRTRCNQVEAQAPKEIVLPPHEDYIALQDKYIRLEHELNELKNAIKPQTGEELHRSDSTVQHMGGSDIIGQVTYSDSEGNRETT